MKIFYFGYYTKNSNINGFLEFPGCNNKMSYIIDCLKISGFSLEVVCLGESKDNIANGVKNVKVDSLENNFFLGTTKYKFFSKFYLYIQIAIILIFKVKKEDTVIFYHSYYLLFLFKLISFFKKINLIIEVEESYKAAWGGSEAEIKKEVNSLKGANGYIYVNNLLPDIIEKEKPYVVCYGAYDVKKKISNNKNSQKKIMVYAGLISDNFDSDVYLAVKSVNYLDESYYLSILGYGSDSALERLKKYIIDNNLNEKVKYEGFLKGEEYMNFLQKCTFAVNPRILSDNLSDYTFPSKVLAYLSAGLPVVSTPIRCIQESKISDLISFSENNTPLSFSNAIISLDFNVDSISKIESLNESFISELQGLIKNVAS